MKFLVLIIFLFLASPCHSKSEFDFLNSCLLELVKINGNTPFHWSPSRGPRRFKGSLENVDGIFFSDKSGNYHFIPKTKFTNGAIIKVKNNEVYIAELKGKESVLHPFRGDITKAKSIKHDLPINNHNGILKAWSRIIQEHGNFLLNHTRENKKRVRQLKDFDIDGLKEYKVLSTCELAAKKTTDTDLLKLITKLKRNLAAYSDLEKNNVK